MGSLEKDDVLSHFHQEDCYLTPSLGEPNSQDAKSVAKGSEVYATGCISQLDKEKLKKWNQPLPIVELTTVHDLVIRKAKQCPQNEAVCAWDGSLTFSELDRLSSVLATRLTQTGVVAGAYVPFAFEKSIWAIVAVLATLKAGGAFVPLDPCHPRSRLGLF